MSKVTVEFINTCPNCDAYGRILKEIADKNKETMELKLYYAGKDMEYIPKYGMVTKGTMIVNGKEKYEEGFLNKRIINEIIIKALNEGSAE